MDEQKREPEPKSEAPAKPAYSKMPSYFELYANNVVFESNVWDLNLIFALLDQDSSSPPFKRVGSVHVPWTQAKIMAYFLLVNIAFHEVTHGPISVPSSVLPQPFEEYAKKNLPDNDVTKALVERVNQLRKIIGM